jgi:methionyl-tRNA formyltransferase
MDTKVTPHPSSDAAGQGGQTLPESGLRHGGASFLASDLTCPPGASPVPGREFFVLKKPGRTLVKYVFIQDDPFLLPKVLDKYLREFADSTAGINIQPSTQGKRTLVQTALDLLKMYGPWYFQWKLRKYLVKKLQGKIVNGMMGSTRTCHTVAAVAKKYNVPIDYTDDVNAPDFRQMLKGRGVEFIVSISGTMLYKKDLRMQTPFGIVNCHGALLPKYRGLMPSFWTLANDEKLGGSSVHFVDRKLDNGPLVVQKKYRIHRHDTLEDIMSRSKDLAAEAIIECVRLVEAGDPPLMDNPEDQQSHFHMPTKADVERFKKAGHRFF